ncbi:MAG: hypothetical protein JO323_23110 [Acidobacteriia bacterium]|nr:hypothetical protein [Terriglobia bacterium]
MDLYPSDGSFDEFKSPDITAWKLARAAIEHENNLVNQRLTWLSTSQAFLFSAFALIFLAWTRGDMKGSPFQPVVPWILTAIGLFALYICLALQVSLRQAFWAIADVTQFYKKLKNENGFGSRTPPLHRWRKPPFRGILDQHFLPGSLACLWVVILGVLAVSQSPPMLSKIESFTVGDALTLLAILFALVCGYIFGSWKKTTSAGFDDES